MPNLIYSIFFLFALCFLIEQIFYWFLGSYPYRYGFVVKTIFIPNFDSNCWNSIEKRIKCLSIKSRFKNEELYFRYKYPLLVFGPLLFIGQMKNIGSQGVFQIKIGPVSAIFILFLIGFPFISGTFFVNPLFFFNLFLNMLCLFVLIIYFYSRFVNPIKSILEETKKNTKAEEGFV